MGRQQELPSVLPCTLPRVLSRRVPALPQGAGLCSGHGGSRAPSGMYPAARPAGLSENQVLMVSFSFGSQINTSFAPFLWLITPLAHSLGVQ